LSYAAAGLEILGRLLDVRIIGEKVIPVGSLLPMDSIVIVLRRTSSLVLEVGPGHSCSSLTACLIPVISIHSSELCEITCPPPLCIWTRPSLWSQCMNRFEHCPHQSVRLLLHTAI
jgi:hypothetical protein